MELYERIYRQKFNKKWINVNNPKRNSIPYTGGYYLIGSTQFNPFTKEEIYLVKVGFAGWFPDRIKAYITTNPTIFIIDFLGGQKYDETSLHESDCHKILYCIGQPLERGKEWAKVSRETYLQICEKGFDYFIDIKEKTRQWISEYYSSLFA